MRTTRRLVPAVLGACLVLVPAVALALQLRSPAFSAGAAIPQKYTCEGANVSPPLAWSAPPRGTRSLVLLVEDPDAIAGTFTHWVLYGMPAGLRELPEKIAPKQKIENVGVQGVNDFKRLGWGGPCPPPGPRHHYVFKLFALDLESAFAPGATRAQVLRAMEGHVLARAELMGRYGRGRR